MIDICYERNVHVKTYMAPALATSSVTQSIWRVRHELIPVESRM
jgi:hypothetical protein